MKYKYRELYSKTIKNTLIKIVQSKSFYVVQYCKSSTNDFNRKAIRFKSQDFDDIKEFCKNVFGLEIILDDLISRKPFYWV